MIAALARMAFRIHQKNRGFGWDDGFLLSAVICHIGASALLYHMYHDLYINEKVLIKPVLGLYLSKEAMDRFFDFQKWIYAYSMLSWCVLFFVKFAYLGFFRILVRRVSTLTKYWWFVTIISVASWAFCFSEVWVVCPAIGQAAVGRQFPYERW